MAQENNELNQQPEELQKKANEYLNNWKRERADFLNYKKDEAERISAIVRYSVENFILKILPILDNIYLAEENAGKEIKNTAWFEGFLNVKNLLIDFLKKEGIEEIETIGKPLDPYYMEIVGEVEKSGGDPMSAELSVESGIVVEEIQKGYKMGECVIRAAKVKIAK